MWRNVQQVSQGKNTISDVAKSDFRLGASDTAVYESSIVVPPLQEEIPSVPLSPVMLITVSISVLLIALISSQRTSLAFCKGKFKECYCYVVLNRKICSNR